MSNTTGKVPALLETFAKRYELNPDTLIGTLKATAFQIDSGQVSDAQMQALLLVANEYKLNPFTKEVYAFPDKKGGIVPVVGVDGWTRILNQHSQLDGIEFRYSEAVVTPEGGKPCPEWCEVVIYRRDRSKPIVVREYLDEVYRAPITRQGKDGKPYTISTPWQSHTKRMLRHKTLIQGGRIGFGFAGIYDADEAEVIVQAQAAEHTAAPAQPASLPDYPQDQFDANVETWRGMVESGRGTPQTIAATIGSKYKLSAEQRKAIDNLNIIEGSAE